MIALASMRALNLDDESLDENLDDDESLDENLDDERLEPPTLVFVLLCFRNQGAMNLQAWLPVRGGVASSAWAYLKNVALSRDLSTPLLIFLETPLLCAAEYSPFGLVNFLGTTLL